MYLRPTSIVCHFNIIVVQHFHSFIVRVKFSRNRLEHAQVVPARLRPRIFLAFGTRRLVVRQPYAPAVFTPEEILVLISRPMIPSGEPRKKSPLTPQGKDPGTVRLVAQCLNHYATPGPNK